MKKKILYVVNDIDFFISHRLQIANKMHSLGYDVYLAGNKNNLNNNVYLKDFNIKYLNLDRSSLNIFKNFFTLINLFKIIYSIKPNIIHLITLKPIIFGAFINFFIKPDKLICSITGLGNIFSYDNNFSKSFKKYFITILFFILFYRSKIYFIVQNNRDYEFVNKFIKDRSLLCKIKGSGVDTQLFKPSDKTTNQKIKILMASRLIKEKGIFEYFEAANIIIRKYPEVEFILCGSPDMVNPSGININQIIRLSKKYNVTYLGQVNDLYKLINKVSICVLPTYYGEGIPKFLIESLSAGKPIITTNIPGCNEIIHNKLNGFLVEPKDFLSLSHFLSKLINDKKLRISMGKESRKIALQYFSIEDVVNKHINLYDI